MSKEKQRLKKKLKKKRIYSKDKTLRIIAPVKFQNNMQLAQYIYNKYDKWSLFIDKVIFNGEKTNLPPEEDISVLYKHMSTTLRKQVIRRLMSHKEYNPFVDNLPLQIFEENIRKNIMKIQRHLNDQREAISKFNIRDIPVTLKGREVKIACLENPSVNVNEYLFQIGYDIIILHNNGEFIVTSNPKSKNRLLFGGLFQLLNRSEKDTWFLHGHKGIIKTERSKFSKIPLKQLILYMQKIKL